MSAPKRRGVGRPKLVSDDEVLDAVGRAVLAHGPGALTLAHVGALVKLAPATLLQRFGSKRALLRAFSKREATRASHAHVNDDALAILLSYTRSLRTRRDVVNSVAFLLEDLRDPALRAHAAAQARAIERQLARALGGDATLAHALWCAHNGAVIQWAMRGTGSLDASVRAALAPILRGSTRA